MTIPQFAENQNLVFVPALLALLGATVLICLPIVFVVSLRRTHRFLPVTIVALVLAAGALGVTTWQAGIGFATLGAERARVQTELRTTYGLELTTAQVGALVDGGKVLCTLPALSTTLQLKTPSANHNLAFVVTSDDADTYTFTYATQPWPKGYRPDPPATCGS